MAFQSGRNLGLTGSLMIVVLPVLSVLFVIAMLLLRFPAASFSSGIYILSYAMLGITSFIAYILVVVAMRRLSDYYNEPSIYKNTLYGFVFNIVGAAVGVVTYLVFIVSLIGRQPVGTTVNASWVYQFLFGVFGFFIIVFVFGVLSAFFYMRAFNALAEKSKVDNFKTAGLLILIGTVLTIVVIGGLVVWVAWILAALGFYSVKPQEPSPPPYSQAPSPAFAQRKICPYCGAENIVDATYCMRCGKQL